MEKEYAFKLKKQIAYKRKKTQDLISVLLILIYFSGLSISMIYMCINADMGYGKIYGIRGLEVLFFTYGLMLLMFYELDKYNNRKRIIYIDMDGTLVKWRNVSVEETKKEGFFFSGQEEEGLVAAVRALKDAGFDVRILSACYNNRARAEKIAWLYKHGLSDLPMVFVPYGARKSDYDEDKGNVLLDDYSENLREWEASGGKAIKFKTPMNGKNGTWKKKPCIEHTELPFLMCKKLIP